MLKTFILHPGRWKDFKIILPTKNKYGNFIFPSKSTIIDKKCKFKFENKLYEITLANILTSNLNVSPAQLSAPLSLTFDYLAHALPFKKKRKRRP